MGENKHKIKIAIVDDQFLFREGLISLLKEYHELQITLQAANGREYIDALDRGEQSDVVLLDLDMPVMDGIKTTEILRKKYPHIKILILTQHDDSEFVNHFYKQGANGFLLKNSTSEQIAEAINYVMKNDDFFFGNVSKEEKNKNKIAPCFIHASLTEREIEIITLLCNDFSNKKIAEILCISKRTIDTHRKNIMKKIGVKNVVGIITFGVKNNLHLLSIKSKKDTP